MKYEVTNYVEGDKVTKIEVRKYTQAQLEDMEQRGQFVCPGEQCAAKLCLVHNSKNGGRTYFLKAKDDAKHGPGCEYKIGNYRPISIREPENGYFTEEQVNNHVKSVDRDVSEPLKKRTDKKKSENKGEKIGTSSKKSGNEPIVRKTTNSGRVVYGEDGTEGTKGRMSRTYTIQAHHVGKMKTIYGNAKSVRVDEHGQLHIEYMEERLNNIEVIAGPIIEHNYPTIYDNLYLVEEYFATNVGKRKIRVTTGGLITERNGRIIMELLTDGGVRIEGKSVNNLRLANIGNGV